MLIKCLSCYNEIYKIIKIPPIPVIVRRNGGRLMISRLNLIDILYSLPAIFLAFSFHEFACL